MASALLLATMSIPPPEPSVQEDNVFDFDVQRERNARMATLLTFTSPVVPRRSTLIEELVSDHPIYFTCGLQ